jgi:type VII secretion-associated protein (TIGR03931 family)
VSGNLRRVAVQVGRHTVRIAATADDRPPFLLAELAGAEPPLGADGLAALLADVVGPAPDELVLVHPGGWPSNRVDDLARDLAGAAVRVWTISAPTAAARDRPCVVLDVGHDGAEVAAIAADGRILSCRTSAIGGARLDAELLTLLRELAPDLAPAGPGLLGQARTVREQLSLLPVAGCRLSGVTSPVRVDADVARDRFAGPLGELVALAAAVQPAADRHPVLLIGGAARAPLLAELLDDAGFPDVRVAPRPDTAAVLGALDVEPDRCAGRDPPAPADRRPAGSSGCRAPYHPMARRRARLRRPVSAGVADRPGSTRFPAPRRRPLRSVVVGVVGAAAAVGLLVLGTVLDRSAAAAARSEPAGALVQYGYRLQVPAGWEHTGGLPERRRVLLTPIRAPDGSDVIAVERTTLGYDADVERGRAYTELRAEFDAAVSRGSALTGFEVATSSSRDGVRYRQRDAGGSEVDWFVLLRGTAQLSVGCRHSPATADAVRPACALVVGSVDLAGTGGG